MPGDKSHHSGPLCNGSAGPKSQLVNHVKHRRSIGTVVSSSIMGDPKVAAALDHS